jgi:xylulokinase
VASAWGLKVGLPVVAGAGDAAAGAIGVGAVEEGDAFISLGTSGQYFITRDSYGPSPESLIHTFGHGLPGRWFQMAALLNGASPLGWAARLLGEPDIATLLSEAEAAKERAPQLYFLPYLTGERTPHNDAHAKGCFIGFTPATTRAQATRAVLEGVGFALADCQEILGRTGPLPGEIGIIGGGSRSALWMQIIADMLGRPVLQVEAGEAGPALGAARLARIGVTGEAASQVCRKPKVARRFEPVRHEHEAYGARLGVFRDIYRALKPIFPR